MSDFDPDDLAWLDRYAEVIANDDAPCPQEPFHLYLVEQIETSLATLDEAKAEAEACLRGEATRLGFKALTIEWTETEPGHWRATVAAWRAWNEED